MKIDQERKKKPKINIDDKTRKRTNSTIFLLPALMLDRKTLDRYGFVNCYWDDKKHPVEYKTALYMLFEPKELTEFEEFVKEQSKKEEFLEDYDVGDGQVMIVYRFPKKFEKEYKFFKRGQYSKFSKDYVTSFFPMTKKETKDGSTKTISTVFSGIFNKEEWLKKYWEDKLDTTVLPNEYWSVPDENKEVFRS